MFRKPIDPENFSSQLFQLFNKQWFLLTAGDLSSGKFNTMTISWGYMGVMWGFPSVIAAVRPQRYTLSFLNQCNSFTLCAFGEEMRNALKLCGARSGREIDKIAATGLTPEAALSVSSPVFREARLTIECRQVYRDAFKAEGFLNPAIPNKIYAANDFHYLFAGEILKITGTDEYCQ